MSESPNNKNSNKYDKGDLLPLWHHQNDNKHDEEDESDGDESTAPVAERGVAVVCTACGKAQCEWEAYGKQALELIADHFQVDPKEEGKYIRSVDKSSVNTGTIRKAIYRTFTYLKYGHLGKGRKMPIPECVWEQIQQVYNKNRKDNAYDHQHHRGHLQEQHHNDEEDDDDGHDDESTAPAAEGGGLAAVCIACGGKTQCEWEAYGKQALELIADHFRVDPKEEGKYIRSDDKSSVHKGTIRKAIYRTFTYLKYGHLGLGRKMPIPECVWEQIQQVYPKEE